MQYFSDLINNFSEIKKRKFKLTEAVDPLDANLLAQGMSDPLSITLNSNYKHILPQYRLDITIYEQYFQKLQNLFLLYAGKTEEGLLNGQVYDFSQETFYVDNIKNQLRIFILMLGREKISTYEKEKLKLTFSFIGETYFCVSLFGSQDLTFIFKEENNVFKSILNSLAEKFRIQFTIYDIKKALNFYSNQFFKNLSVDSNLTVSKIGQIYQTISQNFSIGSPVHISDLFYIDLLAVGNSKYAVDLIKAYSEGLVRIKNHLGATVITNDLANPGRFIAEIGTSKTLENYFTPKEQDEFSILEYTESTSNVKFKSSIFIDLDKVSLGSKTYFAFYSFLKNTFTDVKDIESNITIRNFLNIPPDTLNNLLKVVDYFCDSINKIFYIPFKATITRPDSDESFLEFPLKMVIQTVLESIKKHCTYQEIYADTYKSRSINFLESILDQQDLTPAIENLVRSKICELLFIAKLAETLNKDKYTGKLLVTLLVIFLTGSFDTGELTLINSVYSKDFILFRTNDLINSIIKPLAKGDPMASIEINDNQISILTYNTTTKIVLSLSDLMYLKFTLYVTKSTIARFNRRVLVQQSENLHTRFKSQNTGFNSQSLPSARKTNLVSRTDG